MNKAELQRAIKAIESHFTTLRVGQSSQQEHTYTEDEVRGYAEMWNIPYPGLYLSPEGELLVPPGMIFLRPVVTFGITDPAAPQHSRGGIYTKAHRQYFKPTRVGRRVLFEGEIIDTYERSGYYYLAVKWEAREENGTVLAGGEEWHTIGFVKKEE